MNPTPLHRALDVAPERATQSQARPEQEFFCFLAGDLRLAVPSENLREVVRMGPLTPLPRTPPFVLGVCGHRGEVLPVVDLLRFLGKGEGRIGPKTRLCVGVSGNFVTGVLADTVSGLKRIPIAEILPPPMGGDTSSEHLIGVYQPDKKMESWNLLNFPKILQTARQRVVTR